jgi:hypothetical protein
LGGVPSLGQPDYHPAADWPDRVEGLVGGHVFMHLWFEGIRIRIFAIAPLPLTVIIVIAVLTEFVW